MDDKTAELRDLFVDVTDAETVTESQSDPRGSIPTDEAEIASRIRTVVDRVRDSYDLETQLNDDELVAVVRSFFVGEDDASIAEDLRDAVEPGEVADTRIQLHLLTEADLDGPIEADEFEDRLNDGESVAEIAMELDVSEAKLDRFRRVLDAQRERRRVGDRFRQSFEYAIGDVAMDRRLTEGITDDGLEDATEDIETNVSF